jgi:hypothetical protein
MRTPCLLLLLIFTSIELAQSQALQPLDVLPGDTVQVTTQTVLLATDVIEVTLSAPDQKQPECKEIKLSPINGPAQKSFSFSIPFNACIGQYNLTATSTAAPATPGAATPAAPPAPTANPTPKNIDISSPQNIRVKPPVTGISPKVLYLGDDPRTLVFLGPPFLKAAVPDYSVRFAGHALAKCGTSDKESPKNGESCFRPVSTTVGGSQNGQIAFTLKGDKFQSDFAGKQSVSLVANGAESAEQELFVVDAARTTPRNYAIGVTAALGLLIYLLLRTGGKTMQTKSDRRSYLVRAFFMDEATQTYSLSKCQFYAWTVAAILGYIFLAVARSIIQGSAAFPDIPGGLPAILMYSAGTSVLATGITSAKGSKGAGEVHPTLADFITSGGVVAPERLQFVVWTVAGIFTFLTIVFKSDPLTLSDLPKIPDGFMQLMGISSAGYLAGKLARKPGPVIAALAVAKVTPAKEPLGNYQPPASSTANGEAPSTVLRLGLQGQGLSPNASVKVDSTPLRADQFWINGTADPQTGFCTSLDLSLSNAEAYLEGVHTLTFVNPDAQAADAVFPIDILTIEGIDPSLPKVAGPVPATIMVKGKNFKPGTKYEWKDATSKSLVDSSGTPVPDAKGAAVDIKDTELTVKRPNSVIDGYKLVLSSEVGLQASYPKT